MDIRITDNPKVFETVMSNESLKWSSSDSAVVQDINTNGSSHCSGIHAHGFVKFDLRLGSIHIKSKFPRLKPKFERKHVEIHEIEALSGNLLNWANQHFVTVGRNEYFKELALATTLFTVYINPIAELNSKEMDVAIKFYFWLWYNDDEIEDAIENKIPSEVLKQGTDQLGAVLLGKYDSPDKKFEDVPNYPNFGQMFKSLLDLHKICRQTLPAYEKRVVGVHFYLHRYFEAQRWFCVDEIDGRYSEETFRSWRRIIAFFDGIAEVVALIHGVTLPDEISQSPILKRILDIANSFGGLVNDLLGMKKEFENGQKDSVIVFKVLRKRIPLDQAVEQVCKFIDEELSDYILLKEVILQEFGHEDNLVRYLDILESLIDGHNMIYPESTRHRSAGSVSLTR